jgi:DNA-binding NarL/FixJ family response regulator
VAEDEALIRLDIRAALEQRGWDVCGEARDGGEAVRLVRGLAPDVALLDLKMPGIDGVEATRRIHGAGMTPIVMMTAYDRPSALVRSLVAGATEYVVKPFVEDELDRAITRAASGGSPAASATGDLDSAGAPKRRAEIVDVAKRLFATNGYDATSIQQIADEVGLLKGSLYYYIAAKDDLLRLTVAGFLNASAAVLRYAQESHVSSRRRLHRFVSARRALHLYEWQAVAILAGSSRSLQEAGVRRAVADAATMDAEFLVDLLEAGKRDGAFRLSGEPAQLARRILDVTAGSIGTMRRNLNGLAIDADAHACAAFVLAALGGSERGRAGVEVPV